MSLRATRRHEAEEPQFRRRGFGLRLRWLVAALAPISRYESR